MDRPLLFALVIMLLLAGCAAPEDGEELDDEGEAADEVQATPAASPMPTPTRGTSATPSAATPAAAATTTTPSSSTPQAPAPATPAPANTHVDMTPRTAAPSGDSDRDGILDSYETELASACVIEGRACSSLGLTPPTVGTRDLVFVQVGRSGTMQDWRYSADVWESVKLEMANLSIHVQVADLGLVAGYDADARWSDSSREGRFWTHYVIYNDPATAVTDDASGSQTFDQITLAERGDPAEERATILHEAYHALLGDLDGGRSACADEEIGGPSHSADEDSVLYTSAACETNDGSVYRLGEAELVELREKPFSVLTEMNGEGWTEAPLE